MRKLLIIIALSTVGFGAYASKHSNVECPSKAELPAANVSPQKAVQMADALLSTGGAGGSQSSGTATR